MDNIFNKHNFYKLICIFFMGLITRLFINNIGDFFIFAYLIPTIFCHNFFDNLLLIDSQEGFKRKIGFDKLTEIATIFRADNNNIITSEELPNALGIQQPSGILMDNNKTNIREFLNKEDIKTKLSSVQKQSLAKINLKKYTMEEVLAVLPDELKLQYKLFIIEKNGIPITRIPKSN